MDLWPGIQNVLLVYVLNLMEYLHAKGPYLLYFLFIQTHTTHKDTDRTKQDDTT